MEKKSKESLYLEDYRKTYQECTSAFYQIANELNNSYLKAIEEIKAAMEGMLSPDIEEKIVCNVEIREVFKISKVAFKPSSL